MDQFTFADAEFLERNGVRPWSDMPTWVPPVGETAGFSQLDVIRAIAAGLTFPPIAETARETLTWFRTLPPERQNRPMAGLSRERESEILRRWPAQQGG